MKAKLLVLSSLCVLPSVTFATRFICDNEFHKHVPQYHVKAYNSSENKATTFILSTSKKTDEAKTIVADTDNREITMGGKGEFGTTYQVKLEQSEKQKLVNKSDQRLKRLTEVDHAQLWVAWDSGDEFTKDGDTVVGQLRLLTGGGKQNAKEVYKFGLLCKYETRAGDK
jgi:hypothetical protein